MVATEGTTISESRSAGTFPEPLAAALARLDRRLAAAVEAAEGIYGPEAAGDPHRGLYVGEAEVARLLGRKPGLPVLTPLDDAGRLVAPDDAPFAALGDAFTLAPVDLDVLLVALASEVDLRYERLYAYLQDDITRRRPSVDLALNLLCTDAGAKLAARARFADDAPLRRHRLVEFVADADRPQPPLLAHTVKVDEHVVRTLLGERAADARNAAVARLVLDPDGRADVDPSVVARARDARATRTPLLLVFAGRPGAGRSRAAAGLAAELGMALLAADVGRAPEPALLFRDARMHDALLFLAGFDALRTDDRSSELERILDDIENHPGIVVLAGSKPFRPGRADGRRAFSRHVAVEFPVPSTAARRDCWSAELALSGTDAPAETIDAVAVRFRLTPGQIRDAVASAAGPEDLFAAARAQAGDGLAALTRKIVPRRTFADIVLPSDRLEQLREVCNSVRHRSVVYDDWGFDQRLSLGKGLNVLFAGPSGTGKTLAAEIVAGELELELYRIDLASVVSKYIGETEKNLARIFAEAETTSAILFFDEADALFGKRSEVRDAHDRYANIEIGYLLQKMEEYEGVVILATSLRRNMDDAFVRRMHFTVEFPLPGEEDRLRIWQGIWPEATPLDPGVALPELAQRFELSGGHIRNVAVAAAFLAAADGRIVTMDHVLRATRREYQKLGQVVQEGEFDSKRIAGERRGSEVPHVRRRA